LTFNSVVTCHLDLIIITRFFFQYARIVRQNAKLRSEWSRQRNSPNAAPQRPRSFHSLKRNEIWITSNCNCLHLTWRGVILVKISRLFLPTPDTRNGNWFVLLAQTFRTLDIYAVFLWQMQVRAEDSCNEYPTWKYATNLFSRLWNRRLFNVAERIGELENPRFAPPTLSLTRFSSLALTLKLLWITSLLLLLSLQCFTIVKCYDTSRPPFVCFHGSIIIMTSWLPSLFFRASFYSPIPLRLLLWTSAILQTAR